MNSQLILEEINKARDSYNSLFSMYIKIDDDENQRCYKRMLDNQRKSLEELIKMYRKAKEAETDAEHDEKWAQKNKGLDHEVHNERWGSRGKDDFKM